MPIFKSFSQYELTSVQKKLLKCLDNFFKSDDFCFLLKGFAGTGKTFMMKGLTTYLDSQNRHFIISAPTGRAAKVIAKKTNQPAYTIHKNIYKFTDLEEYSVQNEDGTETFKYQYSLKINDCPPNSIFIVDESSMISNIYSEGEFFRFGSGFLLNDLITYIREQGSVNNHKLIFIGDNAQLPPINMNFSPALNVDYLAKEFNIEVKEYELIETVRQKENSGILHNATKLRQFIQSKTFNQLQFDTDFSDVNTVNDNDFLSTYLKTVDNKIDENIIVIAYSNASVSTYNKLLRTHFFPNKPHINSGDRIVVVANSYNYDLEILNGDFGNVVEAAETTENRMITLKEKSKNGETLKIEVPLIFRKTRIEFENNDGNKQLVECLIIDNLLNNDQRELSSNETKALYIDFWIRNPLLDKIRRILRVKGLSDKSLELKEAVEKIGIGDVNDKLFKTIQGLQRKYFATNNRPYIVKTSLYILKEALKSDPYFNALRIKFGYAVTCHKAQGGEWNNVFVDCKISMNVFTSSYYRWLYTAITRAKDHLFTLGTPNHSITSQLQPLITTAVTNSQITISIISSDMNQQFDIPDGQPLLKGIILAVFDLIDESIIKINSVSSIQSGLNFQFAKEDELTQLAIYYKVKKNKISSIIKIGTSSDLQNEIADILQPLAKKTIVFDLKNEARKIPMTQLDFPEDKPFLKEFYLEILKAINNYEIHISKITRRDYAERYHFQKGENEAVIDFHYKRNKQFRKYSPLGSLSTSPDFLNSVCKLIGNLI